MKREQWQQDLSRSGPNDLYRSRNSCLRGWQLCDDEFRTLFSYSSVTTITPRSDPVCYRKWPSSVGTGPTRAWLWEEHTTYTGGRAEVGFGRVHHW